MSSYSSPSPKPRPWVETPLIESSVLSREAGCRIFLKLENLQPGASFKSRGIGYLVQHHFLAAQRSPDFDPDDLHFFSSSGGNAGMACVTAARSFGVKSTVVVPLSTPQSMITKIKAAGATGVIQHGDMWAGADQHLRDVVVPAAEAQGQKAIYIPPFDDPLIWQGASTMVDEIKKQLPDQSPPDVIVCSVGGGGLFSGIMAGVDRVGWKDDVQVVAVETRGADSLHQSVKARELVTLPKITSIAKTLGASRVASRAFEQALRPNVLSVVLRDADAVEGCCRFLDDERVLVEPSCGVSVALAYRGRLRKLLHGFRSDMKVVIVVCGGSVVSLSELLQWRDMFAAELEGNGDGVAESGLVQGSGGVPRL